MSLPAGLIRDDLDPRLGALDVLPVKDASAVGDDDLVGRVRVRADAPDEVVVTDGTGIIYRQYTESAKAWVKAIADEAGWQAHTEAQPGAGLLEAST